MPFYRQIYSQIVHDIEIGKFRMGDRLPSIRPFAQQRGVSRNTVEQAYLQLVQEGYVSSRQGSGYYVSLATTHHHVERSFDIRYRQSMAALQARDKAEATLKPRYDLSVENVDPSTFPFYRWARISRDVMLNEGRVEACAKMDPRGLGALREQIARSLIKDQDIIAQPSQIAIFPTLEHAVASVLRLLAEDGFTAVFDDPCQPQVLSAMRASGIGSVASPLNPKERWIGLRSAHRHPYVVCTAPANRFPTNSIMPLDERTRLVAWASQTDSLLLENTYCQDLRLSGPQLPTLHALDTEGRVIVAGSFAESLSPSMGLAYLVLPPQLMIRWLKRRGLVGHVPWQEQATFAEFMRQDLWPTYLRRLQTTLRNKRMTMAAAVNAHMGGSVSCIQQESSLHMLLHVIDGRSESELIALAARKGVRVYPTSSTWTSAAPAGWNHVIAGYGGIPLEDIEPAIAALAQAWFG